MNNQELKAAFIKLVPFIGVNQISAMLEICDSEEAQFMIDKVAEMVDIIEKCPVTYQQEEVEDPICYLHYFKGGCDFFIYEKDKGNGEEVPEQTQAFGSADLGYGSELGYISIVELLQNNVELDLYFTPKPLSECLKGD